MVKEGADADAAVTEAARRTTSRRELARMEGFEQVSPEVGELDEEAFDEFLADDPDAALALLAEMTSATDPALRALAQRLAGRLMLEVSRRGPTRPRGIGRIVTAAYRPDGGDLDLDASLEPLAEARRQGVPPDIERLRIRSWARPGTALCLLVDRSGSMGGRPLATAALAAAAVAWRAPQDYSVLAFGRDVIVTKSQDVARPPERVVGDVLALRGFGTTDLAGALRTGAEQLSRSTAGRQVAVLLSDCRATVPGDVAAAARALAELCIVAPAGEEEEAVRLADQLGARVAVIDGPAAIPDALSRVLGD